MIGRQCLSTLIFKDKDGKRPYNDRAYPVQKQGRMKETSLVDRRYYLTVAVRFDYPTKAIPEYKQQKLHCTLITNSSTKHHGQLVRKLFQLEELSTVMQKYKVI